MAPLYETLATDSVLERDQRLLDSMRAKIDEEIKKLDEKWASFFFNLILDFGFIEFRHNLLFCWEN